jgi:hypothetical protein
MTKKPHQRSVFCAAQAPIDGEQMPDECQHGMRPSLLSLTEEETFALLKG